MCAYGAIDIVQTVFMVVKKSRRIRGLRETTRTGSAVVQGSPDQRAKIPNLLQVVVNDVPVYFSRGGRTIEPPYFRMNRYRPYMELERLLPVHIIKNIRPHGTGQHINTAIVHIKILVPHPIDQIIYGHGCIRSSNFCIICQ